MLKEIVAENPSATFQPTCSGEVSAAGRKLMTTFSNLMYRDVLEDKITSSEAIRIDLTPGHAHHQAKEFLMAVDYSAHALQIGMCSRKYRQYFTRNYRTLMPSDRRLYRLDVLEAAQDGHDALWVNGQKFLLGPSVLEVKAGFRRCWQQLLESLRLLEIEIDNSGNERTDCKNCSAAVTSNKSSKITMWCRYCEVEWLQKLGLPLLQFDIAWTSFERKYINELIDIERESRRLITSCIEIDDELCLYESLHHDILAQNEKVNQTAASARFFAHVAADAVQSKIADCNQRLIGTIAELNAAANSRRKGRKDFEYGLFRSAFCITARATTMLACNTRNNRGCFAVARGDMSWASQLDIDDVKKVTPLALPLIDAFLMFRAYFRQVGQCPERVDPHLSQNAALVDNLCQLEASWDQAMPHLASQENVELLIQYLRFIREAAQMTPTGSSEGFEDLVGACDVSAIFALPRLLILHYLSSPMKASPSERLMRMLLPQEFGIKYSQDDVPEYNQDINQFDVRSRLSGRRFFKLQIDLFNSRALPKTFQKAASLAAQLSKAIKETGGSIAAYSGEWTRILNYCIHGTPYDGAFEATCKAFLMSIEELSILVQRASPSDWNAFLQVVVTCLQGPRVTQCTTIDASMKLQISPTEHHRLIESCPAGT